MVMKGSNVQKDVKGEGIENEGEARKENKEIEETRIKDLARARERLRSQLIVWRVAMSSLRCGDG